MKAFLLYQDQDFDFDAPLPPNHDDLSRDLELPALLEAMALGDQFIFEVAFRILLASLTDGDAIRYRQAILADCLEQPEVIRDMYGIAVAALQDKRGIWGLSSQFPSSILSGAVHHLELFVERLKQLRKIADDHLFQFRSAGMLSLLRTLQRELSDDYFEEVKYHLKQMRFRDGELMSAELGNDNSGVGYVLRSSGHTRTRWRERLGIGPRTTYGFTLPPRDEAGSQALSDLTNRGINLVANAAAQSADHISSFFTMLRAELGFYVGCLNLRDQLRAMGEPAAFPRPTAMEPWRLSAEGLYDVCLCLRRNGHVVGNDLQADDKSLVIITGANSGGKSTFLRSVGLAQLMMQCGMFVGADSLDASPAEGVFTHFIREEDSTMTSGRLDEELSRMSVIADQIRPCSLMLFNETFAATNEREGSEIARQVVRALRDAQVRVVFVTHQFDFAESFRLEGATSSLFLHAERSEKGERSYKLAVADPLPTSFGEDIYWRLGGWLGETSEPSTWLDAQDAGPTAGFGAIGEGA